MLIEDKTSEGDKEKAVKEQVLDQFKGSTASAMRLKKDIR